VNRADIFDYDYVAFVNNYAMIHHIPTGYALFNLLPGEGKESLIGRVFNPFVDNMTTEDLMEWVERHLIFDGNGLVVKIFNNYEIVWEK
jgi:thiamine kinase-like enzyme